MFEQMSDEDILELIKSGDNEALEYLIKKYGPIVKKECRTFYLIGGESEDLIQEGMIGLIKAAKDYNKEKGAAFSTFATMCIKRQIITAVNSSNRKKHSPLNTYISFYESQDDEGGSLVDFLEAGEATSPEKIMVTQAESAYLNEIIEKKLSKFEKLVLKEYLTGDSYELISTRLNKPIKSIDNAIQRIRKKLVFTS